MGVFRLEAPFLAWRLRPILGLSDRPRERRLALMGEKAGPVSRCGAPGGAWASAWRQEAKLKLKREKNETLPQKRQK